VVRLSSIIAWVQPDIQQFSLQNVDQTNHPGFRFTLALVSTHGAETRCVGTGFLVAPGLAVKAGTRRP
jgi:hypothetical protein